MVQAPEIFRGDPYNLKADVYSFSLLCHEVLTLERPYSDIPHGYHDKLVFHEGCRPELSMEWPNDLRFFLKVGWSENIRKRPEMEHIPAALRDVILPQLLPPTKYKNNPQFQKSILRKKKAKQVQPTKMAYNQTFLTHCQQQQQQGPLRNIQGAT
jgi:serine/threonine protein kinase